MAPPTRPVTEIQIGGVAYRVQSSADTSELSKLAAVVEARLSDLPASQRHDHRSLVLVALSLAHDLEQERIAHQALRASVAQRLTGLVSRIDDALDHRDENGEPLPPVPRVETTRDVVPATFATANPVEQTPHPTSAQPELSPSPVASPASLELTSHPNTVHAPGAPTAGIAPGSSGPAPTTQTVPASRSRKPQSKSQLVNSDADPSTTRND